MNEFAPGFGEQPSSTPSHEVVRDACLDLVLAIRAKTRKIELRKIELERMRVRNVKARYGQSPQSDNDVSQAPSAELRQASQKLVQPKSFDQTEIRKTLSEANLVPAGTDAHSDDGHLTGYYFRVFEDESSAQRGGVDDVQLVVTRVARRLNSSEFTTEQPLFVMHVVAGTFYVDQGARRLEADELLLPYTILQDAREFYL